MTKSENHDDLTQKTIYSRRQEKEEEFGRMQIEEFAGINHRHTDNKTETFMQHTGNITQTERRILIWGRGQKPQIRGIYKYRV